MQILNKSDSSRTILMKRIGNETGTTAVVKSGCSITLPNDPKILFYDMLNMTEILKKPQIIINKNGIIQ